jgi:hypothetical protein
MTMRSAHKVEAIRKPLLIGQGANDPRVKQAESNQIVNAMAKKRSRSPTSYSPMRATTSPDRNRTVPRRLPGRSRRTDQGGLECIERNDSRPCGC